MTNYEKIMEMDLDELAEFIRRVETEEISYCMKDSYSCGDMVDCEACLRKWLDEENDDIY